MSKLVVPARRGTVPVPRLLLVVLLLAALLTLPALRVPAPSAPAPSGSASGAGDGESALDRSLPSVTEVSAILARRASAVIEGRNTEWLAELDPSEAGFVTEQAEIFDRLRALPVTRWEYHVLDVAPRTRTAPGRSEAVATVRLSYRFVGDTRDLERSQYLALVRVAGRWLLAGDHDGPTERDLWDLAPLTVHRGDGVLVIAAGRTPAVTTLTRRTLAETQNAVRQVTEVWGQPGPRPIVVLIPADTAQLATVLGRTDPTGLDQVAALTIGDLPERRTAAPVPGTADRVVINPEAFARLTGVGRQVVLTHELTHVVTRAAALVTTRAWVTEGFATYVAYREAGLSRAAIVADVAPLVVAGTAAEHLPADEDFDPARGTIVTGYADAWLAFDLMAARDAGLPVRFYRAAVGLPPQFGSSAESGPAAGTELLAGAFSEVLGRDAAAFEADWRAWRARACSSSG